MVYYASDETLELSKGDFVDSYVSVVYKCRSQYVLEGNPENLCYNGQWTNEHPKCRKYCSPEPLAGITIKVSCDLMGAAVPCSQQHPPETRAHITCAVGYRKPADRTVIDVIWCNDDGHWDYYPFRCEQVCGLEGNFCLNFAFNKKQSFDENYVDNCCVDIYLANELLLSKMLKSSCHSPV